MKSLFLIRHAKSSWAESHLTDFERPLNQRGIESIQTMGKLMVKKNVTIGHLFASSSARTHATALGLMSVMGINSPKVSFHEELYHASYRTLLKFTCSISNQLDNVALVGHNPGMTDYVNYLTDGYIDNIPTCGIIKINFKTDNWKEVSGGTGELEFFDFPKGVD